MFSQASAILFMQWGKGSGQRRGQWVEPAFPLQEILGKGSPSQGRIGESYQHGAVTSDWNVSLYSIQDTPPCCPYMVSINKTREYSSK